MMLDFHTTFNLTRDVMPWILLHGSTENCGEKSVSAWGHTEPERQISDSAEQSSRTLRMVTVERNGNILYTWKGTHGLPCIGLYDPHLSQNQLLYYFEEDVHIISCSVNHEKTLLAVSYCISSEETRRLPHWSGLRYMAILVEIQPINNVKVLKVVDASMRVQFLYPTEGCHQFPESHLLVVSDEKYIELCHISVVTEDGNNVVIANTGHFPKDRIAEEVVWAQWDAPGQRLFFIIPKRSSCVLHCVQFYPDDHFKFVFEVPLEITLSKQTLSLVNLGCDTREDRGKGRTAALNLQVFTNKTGGLCLIYVHPFPVAQEIHYQVVYLHKGYVNTFKAATTKPDTVPLNTVSFIHLDSYIAVYVPNQALHMINTRHPELMCYNLFLTGVDAQLNGICSDCSVQSAWSSCAIECCTGIVFSVSVNTETLPGLLSRTKLDCERLAILHFVLLHHSQLENKILEWMCDHLSVCQSFDPIQEFIIASSYRKFSVEAVHLDKLLPYTSVPFWNEEIPGVSCVTEITDMPILKIGTFKGFWETFHSELEYMKVSQRRFWHSDSRRDWKKLINEVDTREKRNAIYQRTVLENSKKVILNMGTWTNERRRAPLLCEEDYHDKELMGLVMVKLKDHLSLHLLHVGKSKIEQIVVDYVSKQLDLVCLIVEVSWKRYNVDPRAFGFHGKANTSEYYIFQILCCISEAAGKMCMPLPPGYHTLHLVLGVRCLPLENFLHCIDSGILQLTEAFVIKLFKELNDDAKNERIKHSIILRLPERISEKVHHLWDHAVSNNLIAMKYVNQLLSRFKKRENELPRQTQPAQRIGFLPLNYLIMMLSDVEDRTLNNPFEEDNIDAAYLEEIALKQTAVLLGLQKN
ncbi:gamma-secretase-activating protein [Pelobates fuscus]|uniref:gamma-secretase-activating protein n=1 Tax=Pelobates fuscus TaxID=191477 RepID=UPI002FE45D0E